MALRNSFPSSSLHHVAFRNRLLFWREWEIVEALVIRSCIDTCIKECCANIFAISSNSHGRYLWFLSAGCWNQSAKQECLYTVEAALLQSIVTSKSFAFNWAAQLARTRINEILCNNRPLYNCVYPTKCGFKKKRLRINDFILLDMKNNINFSRFF